MGWTSTLVVALACVVEGEGLPLLVTTDVDVDDMGALMYLFQAGVDVAGVAVDRNGWSNQYAGVTNVQRIVQAAGCARGSVSVSYGERGFTVLGDGEYNSAHWGDLPWQWILYGVDHTLTNGCADHIWEVEPTPAFPYRASKMVTKALEGERMDVLVLGTFTTLARALDGAGHGGLLCFDDVSSKQGCHESFGRSPRESDDPPGPDVARTKKR